MIKFTVITLFPEALEPYLSTSMMWKATEKGLAEFELVNLRDYGLGPHKSVDDTPYGGGDGMLLRCEPVFAAIEEAKAKNPNAEVILPTPVGQIWNQELARKFAEVRSARNDASVNSRSACTTFSQTGEPPASESPQSGAVLATRLSRQLSEKTSSQAIPIKHYIILCPHYEGYDQRILTLVDHQISLGKYILTGGEIPALAIIDSIVRLIPGVLGGETSAEIESFSHGDNLEYPQYTKPADFRGMKVPEILLSGNHGAIAKWREEQSKQIKHSAQNSHHNLEQESSTSGEQSQAK